MKTKKLTNILKDAKNASNQKTEPYDATGIVKRIENGVAWVHIGGGVDETPVRLTMNAKEGDAVQVRVSGGKAWLTGNATSPPTDDTMAYHATHVAQTAQANARNAGIIAEESQAIAIEASQTVEELSETVITNVVVQYAVGTSPSVAPSSGWSTNSPTWEEGKYIWQRTVTTINGVQITSNVACIQGAKGSDGTSVSILGSYDSLAELEAAHPTGNVGDAYMVSGDLYVWNGTEWENVGQIQGPQGPQGNDGTSPTVSKSGDTVTIVDAEGHTVTIKDGEDGQSIVGPAGDDAYLHLAWANSADGSVDFSTTVATGKQYMGMYSDHTLADSQRYQDYSWTKVKGEQGVQGETGATGKGISKVQTEYYLSTSTSSATGGSWSETPQVFISGRYYWTRDHIYYDDNTDGYSTAVYNKGLTQANQEAVDLQQYFWFKDGTGAEAGAHVTEIPQSDFETTPSGGNLLMKSNKVALREGQVELATFGSNVVIGKEGESHVIINNDGTQFYTSNGTVTSMTCEIASEGNSRTATFRTSITVSANDSATTMLGVRPPNGTDIKLNNASLFTAGQSKIYNNGTDNYKVKYDGKKTFEITNSGSSSVTLTFKFNMSIIAPYFTFGTRNGIAGDHSVAAGEGVIASKPNQFVAGKFNNEDTNGDYAFIVGNGSDVDNPSDAFKIDWDGNIEFQGDAILDGNIVASGTITAKVETPTISFTTTTGTLNAYNIRQFGKIVQLQLGVRTSSATASGSNIYVGTIDTTSLRPLMTTTSATYFGAYSITATISNVGAITIRNSNASSLAATGTSNVNISFTYIID